MKKNRRALGTLMSLALFFHQGLFAQDSGGEGAAELEAPTVIDDSSVASPTAAPIPAAAAPMPVKAEPPKTLPAKKTVRKDLKLPEEKRTTGEPATIEKRELKSGIDAEEIFKSLDYPELQVVPRATDRLQYEAQLESEYGYFTHWPLQVSGLSSLALGAYAQGRYKPSPSDNEKKEANLAATSSLAIGGFWLVATGVVQWNRPNASGVARYKKNKDKDKRGDLFRERIAEEVMESNAKTMRILSTLSIITNLYAAAAVGSTHDDNVAKIALIAGVLAFTPWIFEHRYLTTWEKHLEYKRKIYTPISFMNFRQENKTQNLYPELALKWNF